MHATLDKFGYPATTIREFENWVVLLRPQQCTMGALILAAKSEATSFSTLPAAAFAELAKVTSSIETVLSGLFNYDKINYLMLMMVDPHCHFHVLPRYSGVRQAYGVSFTDPAWPGPPDLKSATVLTDAQRLNLLQSMKTAFTAC